MLWQKFLKWLRAKEKPKPKPPPQANTDPVKYNLNYDWYEYEFTQILDEDTAESLIEMVTEQGGEIQLYSQVVRRQFVAFKTEKQTRMIATLVRLMI